MIEHSIDIPSRNGPIPTFAVCPDGPDAYPGIVLYMDAPGIREELHNLARRIAKNGYFVVLPDMYYRLGMLRFNMSAANRSDARMTTMFAAMNSLTNALVMEDTAAWIGWLDAQEKVKNGPLGCIGYCMSGRYVTTAAARFANRFAASASLYGVGIVTGDEDSPHKLVPKIKGEMYFGFAEHDAHVPATVAPALTDALKTAKVKHTLEILPGSQHGYQFPEREVYDTDASEHSWEKIFAMWERNLK